MNVKFEDMYNSLTFCSIFDGMKHVIKNRIDNDGNWWRLIRDDIVIAESISEACYNCEGSGIEICHHCGGTGWYGVVLE